MADFIYLASQSPRRRQLLEQIGIPYVLLLPDAQEDAEALECVVGGECPSAYVRRVTHLKLDAAIVRLATRGLPPAPILCSDTAVALGRKVYGKPANEVDAEQILVKLAGKTHRVLTAVAVQCGYTRLEALSTSRVSLACMTTEQISRYIQTGEPFGKAGAYAVQGLMAVHIEHISGSYSGIMGLPLRETNALLHNAGIEFRPTN